MSETVIVTGVTGQDGFYLSHYLLGLGHRVVGIDRRTSLPTDRRLRGLRGNPNFMVCMGDVTDLSSMQETVRTFKPKEFYHLAAQSHVGQSWGTPISTCDITGMGTLNCLESIRRHAPECRFYFAGSSEQFGNSVEQSDCGFLDESSPMNPESPYAAAKVFGYNMTQVYRRSYGLYAACGVLFNHESPVRGEEFVTRKITKHLARIYHGLQDHIELGTMTTCRDWGFAGDYVRAMHAILQYDQPDDFVISTGETHSVEEFFWIACEYFNLNPNKILRINPDFIRPKDVNVLIGNSGKARRLLGWKPEVSFESLVECMCLYDTYRQSKCPDDRRNAENYLFPVEETNERV